MFLSNKQIFKLLSPFVFIAFVFYFQDTITSMMFGYLPAYKERVHNILENQMQKYLRIERDIKPYILIMKKVNSRENFIKWAVDKVLYAKIAKVQSSTLFEKKIMSEKKSEKLWVLQAVFPNQKIAILNSKIVHLGSKIEGAVVKKIENDKVLLKTLEGLKWIKLFR